MDARSRGLNITQYEEDLGDKDDWHSYRKIVVTQMWRNRLNVK
jgi:hypothetical protein